MKPAALFFLIFALIGCQTSQKPEQVDRQMNKAGVNDDKYLWLEEVESPRALAKVEEWNKRTLSELQNDPHYKPIESEVRKIIMDKERIPYGSLHDGSIINFWQDEKNVRGLLRRTTLAEYKKSSPKWETILDLDELARKENENWVWQGWECLEPEHDLCMIRLSRGGKDAAVVREFQISSRSFVENGFQLPEAKTHVAWIDRDHLFVATDFGPGTMTTSGYARQVKVWARGEPLASARLVLEGKTDDMGVYGTTHFSPDGNYSFLDRYITFQTVERFIFKLDGHLEKLPYPSDFIVMDIFKGYAVGILRTDYLSFKSGTALAWNLHDLKAPPQVILVPGARQSIQSLSSSKEALFITMLDNVKGRIVRAEFNAREWKITPVPTPENGTLSVFSSSPFSNSLLINFTNFLTPSSVMLYEGHGNPHTLRSNMSRFDSTKLVVEQYESTSTDGEKIPYFVVRPRALKFDGENTTYLTAYGGFNTSMLPYYLGSAGKVFAEKGGVYVLANIRGGGEFGPKWHEAGRLKNRQLVYDDFISVAEDLMKRKITSPHKLGIQGRSNGGLLVSVAFTQRPELFGAVICGVPLTDMFRYHKLLAGFSWVDEYGNPDDPEMAAIIRKYSPYQNLKPGVKYPRVYFYTSTRDDRVHPGHARKIAARMEEYKEPFLYFENIEGGHSGVANLEQRIVFEALEWTYIFRELGEPKAR